MGIWDIYGGDGQFPRISTVSFDNPTWLAMKKPERNGGFQLGKSSTDGRFSRCLVTGGDKHCCNAPWKLQAGKNSQTTRIAARVAGLKRSFTT